MMIAINAVNVAAQTLVADGAAQFSTVVVKNGVCVKFTAGGTTFTLPCAGKYLISVDSDVTLTGTSAQLSIYNNGAAIPGATATVTGTAADVMHIHVQGAVNVMSSCKCVTNSAAVQVISGSADTFSNANIVIEKIA